MIIDPSLDMITGRFYDQLVEARAHVADAYDPGVRERLWRISLELTGAPEPRDDAWVSGSNAACRRPTGVEPRGCPGSGRDPRAARLIALLRPLTAATDRDWPLSPWPVR